MGKLARVPKHEPITIGAYTLTSTGLEIVGRPSFPEHERVGEFIRGAYQASGWWLADWLGYAETRADWRERKAAVLDAGVIAEKTVRNTEYIGKAIPMSRRRDDVDFSTHAEVAALEPDEQTAWLEQAAELGWSRVELRAAIRASKRMSVLKGQATLEGMYRLIYADPPFQYHQNSETVDGSLGKAEASFEGMTIEDLCNLPVKAHAAPRSTLAMYVPAPLVYPAPNHLGPLDVAHAWGFTYKSQYVWDKVLGMPGSYSHVVHENLFIFTRGGDLPDNPIELPKSVQTVRLAHDREHSEKPEHLRKLLEKHWTIGPYLELFGRKPAEGWDVFGNDARLWAEQVS